MSYSVLLFNFAYCIISLQIFQASVFLKMSYYMQKLFLLIEMQQFCGKKYNPDKEEISCRLTLMTAESE